MSRTGGQTSTPRAVIHKRILDIAASNPSASMAEIADEIGGASTELVERVLDQYGDPAENEQDGHDLIEAQESSGDTEMQDSHTMEEPDDQGDRDEEEPESTQDASESDMQPDQNGRSDEAHPDLTERQVKTLRLIEEQPDASQADLADEFDVTRATISRWLNDIQGFEWTRRREHASEILNGGEIPESTVQDDSDTTEELDTIRRRLDALERQLDEMEAGSETDAGGIDPELAHKVVHASMQSERITEAEELQVLKDLME